MAKVRMTLTVVYDYEINPENYIGCKTVQDMFEVEQSYFQDNYDKVLRFGKKDFKAELIEN